MAQIIEKNGERASYIQIVKISLYLQNQVTPKASCSPQLRKLENSSYSVVLWTKVNMQSFFNFGSSRESCHYTVS